jgi:hypothetical protein
MACGLHRQAGTGSRPVERLATFITRTSVCAEVAGKGRARSCQIRAAGPARIEVVTTAPPGVFEGRRAKHALFQVYDVQMANPLRGDRHSGGADVLP